MVYCIYVCEHVPACIGTCIFLCVSKLGENLWESVLCLHPVCPDDQTQAERLHSKCLYLCLTCHTATIPHYVAEDSCEYKRDPQTFKRRALLGPSLEWSVLIP